MFDARHNLCQSRDSVAQTYSPHERRSLTSADARMALDDWKMMIASRNQFWLVTTYKKKYTSIRFIHKDYN